MRPIELTFSGLRSYRGTASIDFRNLDLFAVIGDTGAGKSTIIEALSLALYGTYTWTGGRLEELICDGVNTMSIQFRFLADGDKWVVSRSRHRNTAAPVNKLECAAREEKVDGNRAVNERIERLLGLTHDQFIRAVVMPQGRFDELLRAKKTERNRILRSIFGLDELKRTRDVAEGLRNTWTPVRDRTEAQRELLPHDPAAEKTAAHQRLATAEKTAARLRDATTVADDQDRSIRAAAGAAERLETTLADVPAEVGDPAADLRGLAERAADITRQRADADGDLERARSDQERLDRARVTVLGGFARRDDVTQAKVQLDAAAGALEVAVAALDRARDERRSLDENCPPNEVPPPLATRVDQTRRAAADAEGPLRAAEAAVGTGRRSWERLNEARTAIEQARRKIPGLEDVVATAAEEVTRAEVSLDITADALNGARAQYERVLLANAAVAAADGCAPGDPCPVCARDLPDTFEAPVGGDLHAAQDALEAAEAQLEQHRADTAAARGRLVRAEAALQEAQQTVTEAETTAARLREETAAAGVDVDAADDAKALERLDAAAADARTALQTASEAATAAQVELTTAETELRLTTERYRELVAAAEHAANEAQRRIAEQQRLVDSLPDEWRPDLKPTALRAVVERLDTCLARLDELDTDQRAADAARTAAEGRLASLRVEYNEAVTTPAADTLNWARGYAGRVNDVARAVAFAVRACDLDPVELPTLEVVDAADDLDVAADGVAVLLRDGAVVCDSARRLADELVSRRDTATGILAAVLGDTGCATLGELHQASGQAMQDVITASDAVAEAERTLQLASDLDAVIAVARPFVANLDVLANTLRDQHFVGHLVSLREAELLAEATRRLKTITGGRYGFVPHFGIVNIASGEIRTPDNLSGGERFQAALALALALVEIASRGGGRLDAVFVDEGFGTLDSAALDVALQTLGTVAGGGKMVALISHLRPVAEYVDTVLHVAKHDLFGSTISVLTGEAREQLLADDVRSGLTA